MPYLQIELLWDTKGPDGLATLKTSRAGTANINNEDKNLIALLPIDTEL